MEEKVYFSSDGLRLEGLLAKGDNDKGIVITHPHPLMGGDMHSAVVETITMVCIEKGYTTLRFNFRGTGKSEGAFDEGRGEQDDVLSAIAYLKDMGITDVGLYGYSFGTWVTAFIFEDKPDISKNVVMVSPPVDYIEFKPGINIPGLSLVITGKNDAYASPQSIKSMMPEWNKDARFEIVDGADHFYFGYMDTLKEILLSTL